jgi:hypothetical protein
LELNDTRLAAIPMNRPHYKESRDHDQQCIAMDLALEIASMTELVRWRICFGRAALLRP